MFNYDDALGFIHKTLRFGSKPGLSRISALMDRLDNPQNKLKFIHIAGTNGKGSTTAMTASVLMSAGYKTGMFISPYLEDFRERIQINGEFIPKDELARLTEILKNTIDDMLFDGLEHPTEFEIVTALAFLWFYQNRCDYIALEVGLGGAIDSTNVIACPEVAVITSISIDHTEYLGDTLEEITCVKCGIIKNGCITVAAPGQPEEVLSIIKRECNDKNCRLFLPELKDTEILRFDINGSVINYGGMTLTIPLIGAHQIKNTLTCVEIMRALRERGAVITDNHIISGIAKTVFAGRLEIVRKNPMCIIDAAHNRDGVNVLSAAIDSLLQGYGIITVMGMLRDKDYASCIPPVAKRSRIFIAATPLGERALDSKTTALIASEYCDNVIDCGDIETAVKTAVSLHGDKDIILACGSLMLIGEVKRFLIT